MSETRLQCLDQIIMLVTCAVGIGLCHSSHEQVFRINHAVNHDDIDAMACHHTLKSLVLRLHVRSMLSRETAMQYATFEPSRCHNCRVSLDQNFSDQNLNVFRFCRLKLTWIGRFSPFDKVSSRAAQTDHLQSPHTTFNPFRS